MRRLFILVCLLLPAAQPVGDDAWWLTYRMNKFQENYNEFVEMFNGGRFDLKKAQKLSKLWRKVENCGMWPKVD